MSITQFCLDNNAPLANYLVLEGLLIPGTLPSMALAVVRHVTPQAVEIPSYYFDLWETLHRTKYSPEVREAARTCNPEKVQQILL